MKKIVFLVFSVLIFASCAMEAPKSAVGSVSLRISDSAGSRTILPTVVASSYRIRFTGPASVDPVTTSSASVTQELAAGTWTIDVEGLNSSGSVVATGSEAGVVVSSGQTASVSITLNPQASGTGTVDVTLSWPASVSIDDYSVKLDGVSVSASAISFTPGLGGSLRYAESVASGSHTLVVKLIAASAVKVTFMEAVQVYANLTSSAAVALTAADFTAPPSAPESLTAAEGQGGLSLAWHCDSPLKTGYRIERMTSGFPWSIIADGIAPEAAQFVDTGASQGTVYSYRLFAYNGAGDSLPSPTASGSWAPPAAGGSGVLNVGTVSSVSVSLSWAPAADAVTPQAALTYKVVRSLSNNIGTAALAAANGTTVVDWTANLSSATASGLSSSTVYWFNVLARDAAGNVASYGAVSARTNDAPGTVEITVSTRSPEDAVIDFSLGADVVVHRTDTMVVSVGSSFDTYVWGLDGDTIAGQASSSVSIAGSSLAVGVHRLTVLVTKTGLLYSKTLRFTVVN